MAYSSKKESSNADNVGLTNQRASSGEAAGTNNKSQSVIYLSGYEDDDSYEGSSSA